MNLALQMLVILVPNKLPAFGACSARSDLHTDNEDIYSG